MKNKVSIMVFVIFISMLYAGLFNNSRLVHSPLIDKKLPEFSLPVLQSNITANISTFPDDIFLLNIWASWCIECIREHRVLNLIKDEKKVRLIGINYKDSKIDAAGWLKIYGNPHTIPKSEAFKAFRTFGSFRLFMILKFIFFFLNLFKN